MSTPRLTAGFWVQAYLARAWQSGLPVYVISKGDAVAGAVAVKAAMGRGEARAWQRSTDPATGGWMWTVLAEGEEAAVDAVLSRARARDPDLWIVEVEDPTGRALLDTPGLDG
jgi:hypothetical protein